MHPRDEILEVVETVAAIAPPADHAARVLARTGPDAGHRPSAFGLRRRETFNDPRALLDLRAGVAAGLVRRALAATLVLMMAGGAWYLRSAGSESRPYLTPPQAKDVWQPRGIERPVLPPEASWAMSPFEEFATWRVSTPRATAHVATWTPRPPSLPPIEMESIETEPLTIAPLETLEAIELPEITLDAIDIERMSNQEIP